MNRGPGDQLTDLLLWVLGTAALLAGTLWAAAHATARLAGAAAPTSDPLTGAWALAHEPDEPSAAWAADLPQPARGAGRPNRTGCPVCPPAGPPPRPPGPSRCSRGPACCAHP